MTPLVCRGVDIAIIRSVDLKFDSRLSRTLASIQDHYHVDLLSWNRKGMLDESKHVESLNLSHSFGAGLRGLHKHLLWNLFIFVKLLRLNPKVVWAIDLDSAVPSRFYAYLFKRGFIYEQYDPFRSRRTFPLLGSQIEKKILISSDIVIFPDSSRSNLYPNNFNKFVIENLETSHTFASLYQIHSERYRATYIGTLDSDRHLEELQNAIALAEEWDLEIWGFDDKHLINIESPNIRLMGPVDSSARFEKLTGSTVILAFYSQRHQNNRLTASNKLFEAALLRIPILTNPGTNLSAIIQKYNLGYVTEGTNPMEILAMLGQIQADIAEGNEYDLKCANLDSFYQEHLTSNTQEWIRLISSIDSLVQK